MVMYLAAPLYIMAFAFDFTKSMIHSTSYNMNEYYNVKTPAIIKISREEELRDIEAMEKFMNPYKNKYNKDKND